MTEHDLPADDLQVGDYLHTCDDRLITVRTIDPGDQGSLTINRGQPDEITGRIRQHATVTRD